MNSLVRILILVILFLPQVINARTLQEEAYEVAKKDASTPVIEKTNSNDHPRIDQYCKNVGIPLGSPYCAASVYTWYKEASEIKKIQNPLYKTGSTAQIYRAALANPMRYKFVKPRLVKLGSEEIKLGDIQLFATNSNFTHGHTAFSKYQIKKEGVVNIEGNTTESNIVNEQREQIKTSKNKGGVYDNKYRSFNDSPSFILKGWVRINQ